MKRFLFVFSIIIILFLALSAGSIAAVEYGAIRPNSTVYSTVGGWGITLIDVTGGPISFPKGDLFIIGPIAPRDIRPGDVVLYAGGSSTEPIVSGYVSAMTADTLTMVKANGEKADTAVGTVVGIYKARLPYYADLLGAMRSPFAIGVFAVVLIASIVLWWRLPSHKSTHGAGLSESDEDIATILY